MNAKKRDPRAGATDGWLAADCGGADDTDGKLAADCGGADGPVLLARDLTVGYDGQPIISGIGLRLEPGRIVTLVGPNGAGKSTILRTVAGQLAPVEGTVYLRERDLSELSAQELAASLAQVLTERPRTELLTCQDIVEVGRYPHTGRLGILGPEDRAVVQRVMEVTHTWELRDRDFMRISDGQRQRVMLARALCQEPRVLLPDVPTSFLDIHSQIELLELLRALAREQGMAVLMSLHELNLARVVSDWVICVRGKRVFAQGRPEEVFVPEVIDELFDLRPGTYDALSGSVAITPGVTVTKRDECPGGNCHSRVEGE